jgi:O-antigen/teichoic acid export membrane protein
MHNQLKYISNYNFKRAVGSSRIIAMGEQGTISGANLFLTIMLARYLTIEEYGAFALAVTLLLLLKGFQRAIVSIPLIVLCPDLEKLYKLKRNWHILQAIVVLVPLLILAGVFIVVQKNAWMRSVLLSLMILIAPTYYYEFYRRWLIQEQKIRWLLPMAFVYAAVIALVLGYIATSGGTALTGAVGMSAGALAASMIGLFVSARNMRMLPSQRLGLFFSELWQFSRWQVWSHMAYSGYNSLVPVIVSFFVGPAGVAVMNVTRNFGQPIQTFIMAVDNVDKPRASAALASGGLKAMKAALRNTTLTLIIPGGLYLAIIGVFAGPALRLLFGGKYDHAVLELRLWLPIFALMLLAQPLESGLYLFKRADILFRGRIWAAVMGIVASLLLIPMYGVAGALVALFVGWLVSTRMAWRGLLKVMGEYDVVV